ncbi:hypothetical protein T492DRAFT_846233 [Pavlovales sp. CCMP2436]|nr:hypothetical protein T492DRAFT_846233 [Pavlovales sp. CCMP2436]
MPSRQILSSRRSAPTRRRTRPYSAEVIRRIEIFTDLYELYGQEVPDLEPNLAHSALVYTDSSGFQRRLPSTQRGFDVLEKRVSKHSDKLDLQASRESAGNTGHNNPRYPNERTNEPQPYVNDDGTITLEHFQNPFGFHRNTPYNLNTTTDRTGNPLKEYCSESLDITYVPAYVNGLFYRKDMEVTLGSLTGPSSAMRPTSSRKCVDSPPGTVARHGGCARLPAPEDLWKSIYDSASRAANYRIRKAALYGLHRPHCFMEALYVKEKPDNDDVKAYEDFWWKIYSDEKESFGIHQLPVQ